MSKSNGYHFSTQSLSNRQFSFLTEAKSKGGISLDHMLSVSQGTAGSLIQRGFLKWHSASERFQITPSGLDVMQHFDHTDISRKAMYLPLSSRIDNRDAISKAEGLRTEFRRIAVEEEARDKKHERKERT